MSKLCKGCNTPLPSDMHGSRKFCLECRPAASPPVMERVQRADDYGPRQPPTVQESAADRLAEAERRVAERADHYERLRQRLMPKKRPAPVVDSPPPTARDERAEKIAKLRNIRIENGATLAEEQDALRMLAELMAS